MPSGFAAKTTSSIVMVRESGAAYIPGPLDIGAGDDMILGCNRGCNRASGDAQSRSGGGFYLFGLGIHVRV
jgi:hypothetical protein